jgi:rRNA maturation endonuclease Nob1
MSVLETVKSAIGIDDDTRPTYHCQACGSEFQTTSEPDSHWFECPECGSSDAEALKE